VEALRGCGELSFGLGKLGLDLRRPWDETNELEDAFLFTCVTKTNEVLNGLAEV